MLENVINYNHQTLCIKIINVVYEQLEILPNS